VCFGEELKEWWWWKWGGGRGGMVEIVIGNQVDRLWGRDFYTAYGVMDTYWESKSPHSVEAHHELWKQSGLLWDPMSVRTRDVEAPIWDARIYFLSVWSANLDRIVREWDMVTGTMEYQVAQR